MSQIGLGAERPVPKTKDQAKRLFSNDKIKNFTKLKLQEYIESFFTKSSENFNLLNAVSPRFIHYNISRSFDPKTDPTQRRLQIARYFNELYNIIPSILVVDGGIIPVAHNIGLISDAYVEKSIWRGFYPILRRIPITVIAAARDMDEADEMSGLLSLMFNEMRNLAGGNYISGNAEQGENWVISLPNAPVEVGALTSVDVQGDPVEKIWYTECSLDVSFEDCLAVKQNMPEIEMGTPVIGDTDLPATVKKPVIHIANRVPINSQPQLFIENFQNSYRIILSNSKVATLSYDMKLTPRMFGKVVIKVLDSTRYQDADTKVLAEKEIEIV
jgi:hypothetical protein